MPVAEAFQKGRPALIGYLPAGFPSVEEATTAIRAMIDAGRHRLEGAGVDLVGLPAEEEGVDVAHH